MPQGVTRESDVADQTPDVWATDLFAEAEKKTFFHRLEGGEGSDSPIIRRDDLERQPGDNVFVDIILALTGEGLTGDTDQGLLDGNEEKLVHRQTSFTTDALRHGVRWTKLGKIRINHRMRNSALKQLQKWLAGKLDDKIFAELSGEGVTTTLPTTYELAAGTGEGTEADVEVGDVIDLDMISSIKAIARVDRRIQPVSMANGEEMYFLVLHDYAGLALKQSADWKTAQREARERAADNPIFTGALGIWDNVVLLQSDRIIRKADGGAGGTVPVARNLFLGANALMRGYAYYPDWNEQYFSYGEEQGIGTFCVLGEKLTTFDLQATATPNNPENFSAVGGLLVHSSAPAPSMA